MRNWLLVLIAGLSILVTPAAFADESVPTEAPAPNAPAAAAAPDANRRSVAFVSITRGDGVDEGLGSTIEEVLVAALGETGRFVVVDRNQIGDVLKLDAQKQALGCEDQSCIADVKNALDVQLIGSAHVGHIGSVSVVTLKLLDATSAAALVRTEETVPSDTALIGAAQTLAGKAVHEIWPDVPPPAEPAASAPPTGATPGYAQPAAPGYSAQPTYEAQPPPSAPPTYTAQPAQPAPTYTAQPYPPSQADAPPPENAPPGGEVAVYAPQAPVSAEAAPATSGLSQAVVDLTSFEAPLAQYGSWIDLPGVGHVWRPNPVVVGPAFRPYATGGHWANTDAGWAFVSDYDWGWAPFHYGRWWYDVGAGWVWLPGHIWSPAWVSWREGGGYLGWAPLAPNGWAFRGRDPADFWCFVEPRYMVEPRLFAYALPYERARTVYVSAGPLRYERGVFRAGWHPGPSPARIAVAYGRPLAPVRYASVARPAPVAFHAFYTPHAVGGAAYGQRPASWAPHGGFNQPHYGGPYGTPVAPHYGGGSPVAPHYGGGTPVAPHYGGGTPVAPHYGGGTPVAPHYGGGSSVAPHYGGGTPVAPHYGGGTPAAPHYGGGPVPHAGGIPPPSVKRPVPQASPPPAPHRKK
jgi:hypothetical protein